MTLQYPPDPQAPFMLESGPRDPDLVVNNGNFVLPSKKGRSILLHISGSLPPPGRQHD